MCNLYSMTRNQEAIRRLFKLFEDRAGNLAPMPAIYPDRMAPVIRMSQDVDRQRQLEMMRWGFPPPPDKGPRPVTNVRNTKSSWWRPWLQEGHRCLVPVSSFSEWTDSLPKTCKWFALNGDEPRPVSAFAGIWRPWNGTRGTKADPVTGEHLLFSFLTTRANDDVKHIHDKAMPVILRTEEEWDIWLRAPIDEALKLQTPLPNSALRVCLSGVKEDSGENSL